MSGTETSRNPQFPKASAWIDLVDDIGGRVALVGLDADGVDARLLTRGAVRVAEVGTADTVFVSAEALGDLGSMSPEVTIACLAVNRVIGVVSRMSGRNPSAPGIPSADLRQLRRALPDATVFGLLPSAQRPHTAFDLEASETTGKVVEALRLHVSGWRVTPLSAIERLAGTGWGAAFFPAWLVVQHGYGRACGQRVTGQFSYEGNEGLTRFRGEPPEWVEREAALDRVEAERTALLELGGAGGLTPLVDPDARPSIVAASVLCGQTLAVGSLDDDQIVRYLELAATALSVLQARTRHADGSVLVHGDYWLGNILVDGDRLVGVIDWEEAHRGADSVDRKFLVESLLSSTGRTADAGFVRRVRGAVEHGMSVGHSDGQPLPDQE